MCLLLLLIYVTFVAMFVELLLCNDVC